jgi:hypothetical protein
MSLPINQKAFDLSLLDSLTRESLERPNESLQSQLADLPIESQITWHRKKWNESFSSSTEDLVPNEYMSREQFEYRRRMNYEALMMLQQASPPDLVEMPPYVLESLRRDMDTRVNEAISASWVESTPSAPLRSSTDRSNLSGASLTTSFLSRTSAKNSTSSQSSSRSGLPKLLSSPSGGTATKNSTRS